MSPSTTDRQPWFELLQFADSALPVGGFAFSNGLESAAKLGLVESLDDLTGYLEALLDQAGSMDIPFLNSISGASWDDEAALRAPLEAWDAFMVLPATDRASLSQGRGLLRLLEHTYPDAGCRSIRTWLARHRLAPHYLGVFALGMRTIGHSLEEVQRLYLYVTLRDQVSAAIRLGLVGPMDGHVLQRALHARCERARLANETRSYLDAVRCCPALEIAQGYHEHLYSRLFQN